MSEVLTNRSPRWLREMADIETEEQHPLERVWENFEAARNRVQTQRYAAQSVERLARDASAKDCQALVGWKDGKLIVRFVRDELPDFLKKSE